MKTIFIFFAIITSTNIFGQSYKIKVTEQRWSGGICCRSGISYHISIRTKNEAFKNIHIDSISIQNNFFLGSEVTVSTQQSMDSLFTELDFQLINDEYKYYEGPEHELKTYVIHNNKPMIYARLGRKKIAIEIKEVKILPYLAYP